MHTVFSHNGPSRSAQQNRFLVGLLSLVAGYVDAAGIVLVGNFTSHMTGNIARLAMNSAAHDYPAAVAALLLVVAFFLGSFTCSTMLQANAEPSPVPFAFVLALEGLLLLLFALLEDNTHFILSARLADSKAGVLCFAMGLQNSLVTSMSGARVRTTHLTGVVTDLGVEAARWFRWHRWRLSKATGWPLMAGTPANPPERATLLLHLSTFLSFLVGGMGGAMAASAYLARALAPAVVGVAVAAGFALYAGRKRPTGERNVVTP